MGGVGFFIYIKILIFKFVEFFILNGIECEFYIIFDD